MSHILPLLKEMRGRLGMYVGSTSLTKLAAFLRGYDHAMTKCGVGEPDSFLPNFRDWVQGRCRSPAQSWEDVILAHSSNDVDAVKRFWELLEEYLEETELEAKRNGGPQDAKEPPRIHTG